MSELVLPEKSIIYHLKLLLLLYEEQLKTKKT
jgi:hypothetical protein